MDLVYAIKSGQSDRVSTSAMVTSVNIHEAKTHLSRLLARVQSGEEIVIAKAGRPVARLVPFTQTPKQRRAGSAEGEIKMSADFDAPLPDSIRDGFGA